MYTYVITTQLKIYISSTIRSFFCPTLVRNLSLQSGLYSDLHHRVLVLSDSELHRHGIMQYILYSLCLVSFMQHSVCEIHPCLYILFHSYLHNLYLQRKVLLLCTLELQSPVKSLLWNKPPSSVTPSDEHL